MWRENLIYLRVKGESMGIFDKIFRKRKKLQKHLLNMKKEVERAFKELDTLLHLVRLETSALTKEQRILQSLLDEGREKVDSDNPRGIQNFHNNAHRDLSACKKNMRIAHRVTYREHRNVKNIATNETAMRENIVAYIKDVSVQNSPTLQVDGLAPGHQNTLRNKLFRGVEGWQKPLEALKNEANRLNMDDGEQSVHAFLALLQNRTRDEKKATGLIDEALEDVDRSPATDNNRKELNEKMEKIVQRIPHIKRAIEKILTCETNMLQVLRQHETQIEL
jgi:rubrerythrin